jgi:hypothetical protein
VTQDPVRAIADVAADAGALGYLAIVASIVLLVLGVSIFVGSTRSRLSFVALTIAGLLPLAIGTVGTVLAHRIVDNVQASSTVSSEDVEAGHRQANLSLVVGGAASTPVVFLGLLGVVLARRRDRREAGLQT